MRREQHRMRGTDGGTPSLRVTDEIKKETPSPKPRAMAHYSTTDFFEKDIGSCLEVWELIIGICLGLGTWKLELCDDGRSHL